MQSGNTKNELSSTDELPTKKRSGGDDLELSKAAKKVKSDETLETADQKVVLPGCEATIKQLFTALGLTKMRLTPPMAVSKACTVYKIGDRYLIDSTDRLSEKIIYDECNPITRNVFLCLDMETDDYIVLKEYSNLNAKSELTQKILPKIENEISLLKEIGSFVCEDNQIDSGTYAFVEKFIPGRNLLQILQDGEKDTSKVFGFEKKLDIAILIINKLLDLHKMGILHRDIKLENIIYDETTNTVTFVDFELALKAGPGLKMMTTDGDITPGLVPPEIATFEKTGYLYTAQSDIFLVSHALGEWLGISEKLANTKRAEHSLFKTKDNNEAAPLIPMLRSGLDRDPNERPSLDEISNKLTNLKTELFGIPVAVPTAEKLSVEIGLMG